MSLVLILTLMSVMAQVEPDASLDTAERRTATAQGGNGTFFQPFINGINTFFNPSQFRNPLTQFRDQQQQQQRIPQQQQQQQQFSTFPQQQQQPQQFGQQPS